METPFSRALQRLHGTVAARLGDGLADYLAAGGALLASNVAVILDREAERLDPISGALDRTVTVTVEKRLLQPLDRQGAFLLDGKTWHIDGIESDDGHLITFYVVP